MKALKIGKTQSTITKPSNKNHDNNAEGAEFVKKMKTSRSSDLDILKIPSLRRYERSNQPREQPPSSSPSYMKSTSCSEARKEQKQLARSLNRTPTITKAQSFKPSRSTQSVGKCSSSTCSSTLKDSKVPPFLDLNPGGTESQGTSVEQVCPYNRCSLNSHKNDSNPPLESFLLARRKVLRAHRIMKPEPRPCEDDGETKEDVVVENETGEAITVLFVEEKADFLVEIRVKEREDKAEVGYEGDLDGEKELAPIDYATSITALDELFTEFSDVELEEGRPYLPGLGIGDGISAPRDQESDHTFVHPSEDEILCFLDEEGVKKDNVGIKFLKEFPSEESKECFQDEITDCHAQFSDSEPSVNDAYEETVFYQFLPDFGCSDDEKIEKSSGLDKKITEASEAENEKTKDSPKSDDQTISTAKIGEESSINEVAIEFLSNDLRALEDLGSCQDDAANNFENPSEETPEKQPPSFGDSDTCKSLKTTIQSRKQGESSEALKPFNPREPNYLELEPDTGAEKVDLRHQEMDERRNAEEWMLDYALRKAVNQLAAARKRKVGLLVEAFETITPPTQSRDVHVRPISLGL